jgi:acetyl-CoA acetyltransferase
MESLERRSCLTGIGQSDVGRRLGRDPLELTLDACLAAIEDAGLTRDDIDGLSTYPGMMGGAPGFTGAGVTEVHDALRLKLDWFTGGLAAPCGRPPPRARAAGLESVSAAATGVAALRRA